MKQNAGVALLVLVLAVQGVAITAAMRTTSTTFDESAMVAAGARGYRTGDFSMSPEHPPVAQYLYGLLPYLAGVHYPDERAIPAAARAHKGYRYGYAQWFFWGVGNDPEEVAFLGRLPAAACGVLLTLVVFGFVRRSYGVWPALLAATLTAFTPDVLAHAGVAYNDVPVALAYFSALWLIDAAVRSARIGTALLAGVAIGVALGVKNSAIGLAPAAAALLLLEAVSRAADRAWRTRVSLASAAALSATYATLVVIYRGDVLLTEWRYALAAVAHQVATSTAPSYLLGEISTNGFALYFPIAFAFKTPAGLHVLIAVAGAAFLAHARSVRLHASALRVPLVGASIMAGMLLFSQLNVGFRYCLPALPLLCVLVAAGAARAWARWRVLRPAIVLALASAVLHPLSYYPHFLAYVNEYGPGRDRNYEVLADSSLDWGQGLLLLRDFMRARGIERVYLSYFGSAWPAGYGIDYLPLPSFFDLAQPTKPAPHKPEFIAVSATNLTGAYFFPADPFAELRRQRPLAVLGHTVFVYRAPRVQPD